MGFTTGFLSGTALTLSLTYLAMNAHAHNRASQAALLRRQTDSLNAVVDPVIREELRLARDHASAIRREEQAGIAETVKDMWNRRLIGEVRKVQGVEWGRVWDSVERGVVGVVERVRRAARDGADGEKK